jgi:hypothetical protein
MNLATIFFEKVKKNLFVLTLLLQYVLFSYKTEAVRRRQESLSIATELISKLQMDRWASSFL